MRRLNLPISVLSALIVSIGGLVAVAPAAAYNVGAVYRDCENNGALTGHYSQAELQAALNQLPAQVSEYSACADVIRQALVRASSHSGTHSSTSKGPRAGGAGGSHHNGGGGSGKTGSGHNASKSGSSTSTRGGSSPGSNGVNAVALTGTGVRPGSSGGSSSLPAPLLVVLILLALTAVSGGAVAIRRRVFARHST